MKKLISDLIPRPRLGSTLIVMGITVGLFKWYGAESDMFVSAMIVFVLLQQASIRDDLNDAR